MCWSAFHIEAPYESVKHQHEQEVWIQAVILLFFLKMLTLQNHQAKNGTHSAWAVAVSP